MSEYTQIKKPFGCHSCDKKFFRTLISKYTRIKNYLAATYVTRNFRNSYVKIHSDEKPFGCTQFSCDKKFFWALIILEDAGCSCLFFKLQECCFSYFESEKVLVSSRVESSEKFQVQWLAAKWILIRVYSDMGVQKISCHISSSQIVF